MPIRPIRPQITFLNQTGPVEEYGRAMYAVARSIIRAMLDALSTQDLEDINTPIGEVTPRQLSKLARLDRDKGMRGDGFEWAVHEAPLGKEPRVLNPVAEALFRCSQYNKRDVEPSSLLFGQERSSYLGFLDAVMETAGQDAVLIPGERGRPFVFGPSVSTAALGAAAEPYLPARVKKIWKTDLFINGVGTNRHFATTVKSNVDHLEGGAGLRLAIVPENADRSPAGVRWDSNKRLWIVSLADPDGFMGLFNDTYRAIGRAVCTLGRHDKPAYYTIPSAKVVKLQEQLEKYGSVKVLEVEAALNDAAQQNLITAQERLLGVNPPDWPHMKQLAPKLIAPKPSFVKLD